MKTHENDFIRHVRKELKKGGFKLRLRKPNGGSEGAYWLGSFDEDEKEVICFKIGPTSIWITTLAHEFAHFLQSSEGRSVWTRFQGANRRMKTDYDNFCLLEKMLECGDTPVWELIKERTGRQNAKAAALEFIQCWERMEIDCEKTTVELLDRFHVKYDKKGYLKEVEKFKKRVRELKKTGIWSIE
jgi:hypothetical protein